MNSVVFSIKHQNLGSSWTGEMQWLGSCFFLEREHLLSKIPTDRTVGSRRSKKQSYSTRQGLGVGTDLVELQQLQEVGIFSYLY